MDVDETTPKAVKGERDGPTIDPDEIKPEITKLKSKGDAAGRRERDARE
jgi:hypothetical protein